MGFKLEVGVDNNPIQYNKPMDYKLGYELAQRRDLIYYSKSYSVNLILTYKYIVFNVVGKSNKMKKYSF